MILQGLIKRWQDFNPYHLARIPLFWLDEEIAHHCALTLLKAGFGPRRTNVIDAALQTRVCGLDFMNPVGVAAGFDKQCEAIQETLQFGVGFTELGGVVPLPQSGNPKPRLFRIPNAEAIINRFDFNSDGFEVCRKRVAAWRSAFPSAQAIVGINIAKGNHTADAAEAYSLGLKAFAPYLDFVTVNVSCPNTPNLRHLEGREQLAELLTHVMATWRDLPKKPMIWVKIAPDQTEQQQNEIAETILTSGVHGLIIGNTTATRPDTIPPLLAQEKGGLSGKPLREKSTQLLKQMYRLTKGKLPLIGCGGIFSAEDAYAKIRAGASLVQLYTALVYEGPLLIERINRGLVPLLKRDGFTHIQQAVGADHH